MKLDESYNNVVVMDRYGGIEIGASSNKTQRSSKKSPIFFEPKVKSTTKKPKVLPMVNQHSLFSNILSLLKVS